MPELIIILVIALIVIGPKKASRSGQGPGKRTVRIQKGDLGNQGRVEPGRGTERDPGRLGRCRQRFG